MTQARGFRGRLLMDFEDTYGSDPAVSEAMVMPVNSIGLVATRTKNTPMTLRGNRNPWEPFDGNLDVRGPIVVPWDYTAFWFWLRAMFGAPTTTGEGPYTHVFKIGNAMPSMVMEKQFGDIAKYWKYNGAKIAKWSQEFGGDGELVANLDIIAANETPGTSSIDASPTAIGFNRLQNFRAEMQEGGATISNVTAFSFEMDFGLDDTSRVLGSEGILGDLPEGIVMVTGTVTALFENHTLVDKAIASTETSLRVTVTHKVNDTYYLQLDMDELVYARPKTVIEGPRGVKVELPFTAYYDDDADASAFRATLVNANAGTSSPYSSSSSNSSSSSSSAGA